MLTPDAVSGVFLPLISGAEISIGEIFASIGVIFDPDEAISIDVILEEEGEILAIFAEFILADFWANVGSGEGAGRRRPVVEWWEEEEEEDMGRLDGLSMANRSEFRCGENWKL